jgi:hypothetical protein
MALSLFLSRTVIILLCCNCFLAAVLAQNETEKLPTFGDTVQVLGAVNIPHFSLLTIR